LLLSFYGGSFFAVFAITRFGAYRSKKVRYLVRKKGSKTKNRSRFAQSANTTGIQRKSAAKLLSYALRNKLPQGIIRMCLAQDFPVCCRCTRTYGMGRFVTSIPPCPASYFVLLPLHPLYFCFAWKAIFFLLFSAILTSSSHNIGIFAVYSEQTDDGAKAGQAICGTANHAS
jgi:hypothetical protein